jgi:hypothetical protein
MLTILCLMRENVGYGIGERREIEIIQPNRFTFFVAVMARD